jgi:crossover junction endodeoxyribonuclease RuvC
VRVIGVDPGTRYTGYGVIDVISGRIQHVCHGVISTKAKDDLWVRIHHIHKEIVRIVGETSPDELAIEKCFVSKNVSSALKLGHTRGAIIVGCMSAGLKVGEYAPTEIKSAVTGYGRAEKDQVAHMVQTLLTLPTRPASDAADALAAAICHTHGHNMRQRIASAR